MQVTLYFSINGAMEHLIVNFYINCFVCRGSYRRRYDAPWRVPLNTRRWVPPTVSPIISSHIRSTPLSVLVHSCSRPPRNAFFPIVFRSATAATVSEWPFLYRFYRHSAQFNANPPTCSNSYQSHSDGQPICRCGCCPAANGSCYSECYHGMLCTFFPVKAFRVWGLCLVVKTVNFKHLVISKTHCLQTKRKGYFI